MIRPFLLASGGLLAALTGCGAFTSAENVFDRAVLNTNQIAPLCGSDISSFRHGTAMLVDGKTVIRARADMLRDKVAAVSGNLAKVEALPEAGDAGALRAVSIELHQLALQAYANGYGAVASLYDREATPDEIASAVAEVHGRYCDRYTSLSSRLVELGKPYAEQHGIEVNWGTP